MTELHHSSLITACITHHMSSLFGSCYGPSQQVLWVIYALSFTTYCKQLTKQRDCYAVRGSQIDASIDGGLMTVASSSEISSPLKSLLVRHTYIKDQSHHNQSYLHMSNRTKEPPQHTHQVISSQSIIPSSLSAHDPSSSSLSSAHSPHMKLQTGGQTLYLLELWWKHMDEQNNCVTADWKWPVDGIANGDDDDSQMMIQVDTMRYRQNGEGS